VSNLKSDDWSTIAIAAAAATEAAIQDGTLKPPLKMLVTDGEDKIIADVEFRIDDTGKLKYPDFSPDIPLAEIIFPISYSVTDTRGREEGAIFSEEAVRKLRNVS
jgi:hypothetical protein